MSQRILDIMIVRFEDERMDPVEKERLNSTYHHLINLNVLAHQTKGQILEKLKRYEDAIESYSLGK